MGRALCGAPVFRASAPTLGHAPTLGPAVGAEVAEDSDSKATGDLDCATVDRTRGGASGPSEDDSSTVGGVAEESGVRPFPAFA